MSIKVWGWIAVAVLTFGIIIAKKYWTSYVDDNKVEESVEAVIEETTGINADLTPSSPESTASTVSATKDEVTKSQ